MKLAYEGGFVQKERPLNPGILCLQYADVTIMLLSPDFVYTKRVKILIYIFELLSGLSINFHKSSIYPIGPPSLDLPLILILLHCNIGSFFFINLRLPLKSTTLSRVDWQPLLDRIEKRLVAWKVHSLSRGGRLILVNSVLTSLCSTHFLLLFTSMGHRSY